MRIIGVILSLLISITFSSCAVNAQDESEVLEKAIEETIGIKYIEITGEELLKIKELDLSSKDISGEINDEFINTIGKFKNLKKLNLSNNKLYGNISNKLLEIGSLKEINLSNNYFYSKDFAEPTEKIIDTSDNLFKDDKNSYVLKIKDSFKTEYIVGEEFDQSKVLDWVELSSKDGKTKEILSNLRIDVTLDNPNIIDSNNKFVSEGNVNCNIKLGELETSVPLNIFNLGNSLKFKEEVNTGIQLYADTDTEKPNPPTISIVDNKLVLTDNGDVDTVPGLVSKQEDFEDTTYALNFTYGGSATTPWVQTNAQKKTGVYSFKNPTIANSKSTSFEFKVNIPSDATTATIAFDYMVSSENNYDWFRLYVNGTEQLKKSGTIAWTSFSLNLSPGENTIKFEYKKDSSGTGGSDSIYIDNLVVSDTGQIPVINSGIKNLQYSFDNVIWNIYSAPVVIPEGTWSFSAKAVDNADNESEIVQKLSPRILSVTGNFNSEGWSRYKNISAKIETAGTIYYNMNNTGWVKSVENSVTISFINETTTDLKIKAVYESTTNIESEIYEINIQSDFINPQYDVSVLSEAATDITLQITATDSESGFDYIELPDGSKITENLTTVTVNKTQKNNIKVFDKALNWAFIEFPYINSITTNFTEGEWINKEAIMKVNYEKSLSYNINNSGWQTVDSRVKSVSTGSYHSLILLENGDVYAVGLNSSGQLGLGDKTSRTIPTKIPYISNAKSVAVSSGSSFILLENGDVYSCGSNEYGELGLGDFEIRLIPTKISSISNAKSIAAGGEESLILLENGDVYSCGYNYYGQLGLSDTTDRNIPTKISSISNAKSIVAGLYTSMILLENGDVYSCGNNYSGQLGLGDNINRNIPTKISTISDVKSISTGQHSLILLENGDVYSFGNNTYGQLGLNDYLNRNIPIKIPSISNAKNVSSGKDHSLILLENGDVYSFGGNTYGQLGLNDNTKRNIPTQIPYIKSVKNISCNESTSLITLENGDIYSFGVNTYGGLGLGDKISRNTPSKISFTQNIFLAKEPLNGVYNYKFKALDVTTLKESEIKEFNFKIDLDKPVANSKIISDNGTDITVEITATDLTSGIDYIQLPDNTQITNLIDNKTTINISKNNNYTIKVYDKAKNCTFIEYPFISSIQTNFTEGSWINKEAILDINCEKSLAYNIDNLGWEVSDSRVKSISNWSYHTLILLENGDVYTCGYNYYGQLGLGDTTNRSIPTKIPYVSNAISVSAGNNYSLILLENGDVYSFGYNNYGQLGLGDTTNRSIPTKIPSIANAISISAGERNSLILLENGDVYSFGYGSYGELGLGDNLSKNIPTKITSISNAKEISSGYNQSLILLENGDVYSFGNNEYGQLGLGDTSNRNTPIKIPSISNAKNISAGQNNSLILLENGDVYSFGYGAYGALGLGNYSNINIPTKIDSISNVKNISTRGYHSMILLNNGDVYSFGYNQYGELGLGTTLNRNIPTKIGSISNVESISTGLYTSMILLENRDAYSFGYNSYKQLGLGDALNRDVPTKINSVNNHFFLKESSAGTHNIKIKAINLNSTEESSIQEFNFKIELDKPIVDSEIISDDGTDMIIKITATDITSGIDYILLPDNTQITNLINGKTEITLNKVNEHVVKVYDKAGNYFSVEYPYINEITTNINANGWVNREATIDIKYEKNLVYNINNTEWESLNSRVKFVSGNNHSLILLENGDVHSFGRNYDGQLGLGDTTNRNTPTKIHSISNAVSVSAGSYHSLILLENGDVYSFGYNSIGQLGLGDTTDRTIPTKIPSISNAVSVSAGDHYSLILLENGDVYSFANNISGQLGLGDTTNRSIPTKIPSISNAKSISAGSNHALILLENGDVYSFGRNIYGNLGLGDTSNKNVPTKIPSISNAKSISAGGEHSLILLENGDVYSFGDNIAGQLGLDDTTNRSIPTKIDSISNAISVSAGSSHSLILLENGDVYSFGYNCHGQLGLGDRTDRSIPTKIPSISNAISVSAGDDQSLILLENGDVYSCNSYSYGQLGINDTMNEYAAYKISTFNHPFELRIKTEGNYNCKIKAIDPNATQESIIREINFGIDYDNPTITATEVTNTRKEKKYTINANDTLSGIDYILLPTGEKIYSNTYEATINTNGVHEFSVYDKAGNKATWTIEVSDIDNAKPLIPTIERSDMFQATIKDNGDKGDMYSGTNEIIEDFEDESLNINITECVGENGISIGMDETQNVYTISSPETTGEKSYIVFDVTIEEGQTGNIEFPYLMYLPTYIDLFNLYINEETRLSVQGIGDVYSNKFSYSLSEGTNKIKIEIINNSDISGGFAMFDDIKITTTEPREHESSGIKEIQYNYNNEGWKIYDSPLNLKLGRNIVEAKAVDNAGNESDSVIEDYSMDFVSLTLSDTVINFGNVGNDISENNINIETDSSVNYDLKVQVNKDIESSDSTTIMPISKLSIKLDTSGYKELSLATPEQILLEDFLGPKSSILTVRLKDWQGYKAGEYNTILSVVAAAK